MANFITSYRITKANEGGYHNATGANSADRGGETFKGIARKIHPSWGGWVMIDDLKSKPNFPNTALNDPEINKLVLSFYKNLFWNPLKLDDIEHQGVANEMFDTAVNMGTGVASRFFQRSINYLNRNQTNFKNLNVDGVIGPVTLSTFNRLSSEDKRHVFNLLNILQGARYINIIDSDPSQEVFIRGWLERVELMRRT